MISHLSLRGPVKQNEPLAKKTHFGVGGAADFYFEPADISDLQMLIQNISPKKYMVLGAGSNILIRDGGIPGVVISLGKTFCDAVVSQDSIVCGAGVSLIKLAHLAAKNNISGFEFLCDIPGTLGGGLRTNAGAYGSCLADILISVRVMKPNGAVVDVVATPDIFSYRTCSLPKGWIFLGATLKGRCLKNGDSITQKMAEFHALRKQKLPQGVRTAGSTFVNPSQAPAGQLIEQAGLKGFEKNGVLISDKHANILVNKSSKNAKNIENMGEMIRRHIKRQTGILLQWEVRRVGVLKRKGVTLCGK